MVTRSDRSDSLDVTLTVDLTTQPGEVDIDGQVEGKLGLGVGDAASQLGGGQRNTIRVLWRPLEGDRETLNEINDQFESQIRQVEAAIGTFPTGLPDRPSGALPRSLRNVTTIFEGQLWAGVLGNRILGETPLEFQRSFSFSQVRVPVVEQGAIVDQIPSIPVTIEAVPTEAVQSFLGGVLNDTPRVQFEIPPETFIREVPVSDFNCCELFSNIDQTMRQTRQLVAPAVRTGRSRVDRLVNLANEIITNIPTDIPSIDRDVSESEILNLSFCGAGTGPEAGGESGLGEETITGGGGGGGLITDGLGTIIDRIDPQTLEEVSSEQINQWVSEVNAIDSNTFPDTDESQARNNLDRLENRLSNVGLDRCSNFFETEISALRSGFTEAQALDDRASALSSNIRSLLELAPEGQVDIQEPCSEEFSSVDSNVESVVRLSRQERSSSSEVRREISDARRRVRQEVDRSECLQQFLARLDQAEQNIQEVTVTPCRERFSDTHRRVTRYEDRIGTLVNPTDEQVQAAVREGRNVIDDIRDDVDDPDCAEDFVNRVRETLQDLQRFTREVRVRTGTSSERVEQRQEQILELQQRLNDLVEQLSE